MNNFKNITEVPVVEELVGGENLILNDSGVAKQMPAELFKPKSSGGGADIEANICFAIEKEFEPEYGEYVFDIEFLPGSTFTVNKVYDELKDKILNYGMVNIDGGLRYARRDVNDELMYYPMNIDIKEIFNGHSYLLNKDILIEYEYLSELGLTKEEFAALDDNAHLDFPYMEEDNKISLEKGDWYYQLTPSMGTYWEFDDDSFQELDPNQTIYIMNYSEKKMEEEFYSGIYYYLPTTKAKLLASFGCTEEEFLAAGAWDGTYYTYTIDLTKKQLCDSLNQWFIDETGFEECITISNINNLFETSSMYLYLICGGCAPEGFLPSLYLFKDPDDENGIIVKFGNDIGTWVFFGGIG